MCDNIITVRGYWSRIKNNKEEIYTKTFEYINNNKLAITLLIQDPELINILNNEENNTYLVTVTVQKDKTDSSFVLTNK